MDAKLLEQIQSLTHRQLVRFGRICGVSMGDYMKLGKDELRGKILSSPQLSDMDNAGITSKMLEAFPQGIFHRGEKHTPTPRIPAGEPVKTYVGRSTADTVAMERANGDAATELAALIARLSGGNQTVDADQVRAIVRKELEGIVLPVTVQISTDGKAPVALEGIHHKNFPLLLKMVQAGVNVWLAGPAGTGKTTAAHNVAKALNLPFFFNGAIDNEYKLLGFTDAQGRIVSRPFRKAFCEGGVYLFDEVDASMPGALLAFNSATANGHCDFPDGCFERHKDFKIIAAANTWGQGATADYVGRARMDGAFKDRFRDCPWPIDEVLERTIAGNDKWVSYVQTIRVKVAAKGIKVIISPRASIDGAKLLAGGLTWDETITATVRCGMSDEQWKGVEV